MPLCELCEAEEATLQCEMCAASEVGKAFCGGCSEQLHSSAKGKLHLLIDLSGQPLVSAPPAVKITPPSSQQSHTVASLPLCSLCEDEKASVRCSECNDDYCDACGADLHKPAKMKGHALLKLTTQAATVTSAPAPTPAPPTTGHSRSSSATLSSLSIGHGRSLSVSGLSPANLLRSPMIGAQPAPTTPSLGPRPPATLAAKSMAPRLSLAMFPRTTPPPSAGSPPTGGAFNLLRQLSPPLTALSSASLLKSAPSSSLTPAPVPAPSAGAPSTCSVCEIDTATQRCDECNDAFCDECDEMCHTSASKMTHQRRPVASNAPAAATPTAPAVATAPVVQPTSAISLLQSPTPIPAEASVPPVVAAPLPLAPTPPVATPPPAVSTITPRPPSDNEPSSGSLRTLRRASSLTSAPELSESAAPSPVLPSASLLAPPSLLTLQPLSTPLEKRPLLPAVIEAASPQPSPIKTSKHEQDDQAGHFDEPPSPPSKEWEEENRRLAQLKTQQEQPPPIAVAAAAPNTMTPKESVAPAPAPVVFETPLKKEAITPTPIPPSPIPPPAAAAAAATVTIAPSPAAQPPTPAATTRVPSSVSGPSSAASAATDLDLDLDLGLDDFNDSDFALLDEDLDLLSSYPAPPPPPPKATATPSSEKAPPAKVADPAGEKTSAVEEAAAPPSRLLTSASSTEGPSDESQPSTTGPRTRRLQSQASASSRRSRSHSSDSDASLPSSELMLQQLMDALHSHGHRDVDPSTALLHIAQLATAAAIEQQSARAANHSADGHLLLPRMAAHRPSHLETPNSPRDPHVIVPLDGPMYSGPSGAPGISRRAQRDARLRESAAAWEAAPHPPPMSHHGRGSEDDEWPHRSKLHDRSLTLPHVTSPLPLPLSPLPRPPLAPYPAHMPMAMLSPYHPAAAAALSPYMQHPMSPEQQLRALATPPPPSVLPPPFRFGGFPSSPSPAPSSPFPLVPRSPAAPLSPQPPSPHAVHALAVAAATAAYHHVARQLRSPQPPPPPPPPAPLSALVPADHPILGGWSSQPPMAHSHSSSSPFTPRAPLLLLSPQPHAAFRTHGMH